MHKLVILRGNSGSGKTSTAKGLQSLFGKNTMLISQDVVRREMLKVSDGENNPAMPLMMELLKYGSEHCEVVVLEGIMVSKWYRPLFELAVMLYGTDIYSYYFDIPFEETIKRHMMKSNCNEYGEEKMRSWWVDRDYSSALQEEAITAEEDQESILKRIYLDVTGANMI